MLLCFDICACDACASFSNSLSLGVMPLLKNNVVTTRYNFSRFNTIPFAYSEVVNKEATHSWDIEARFKINKRFQITGSLPYNYFRQYGDFGKAELYGIGDFSILGSIIILNKNNKDFGKISHLLLANGGIKLPVGVTNLKDGTDKLYNPRMQPGTGSLDYLFGANYIVKYNKNSLVFEVSGKINTMNDEKYQMGNLYRSVLRYSRWLSFDQSNLLLNLGLSRSVITDDYSKSDLYHAMHGRKELGLSCGTDLFYKKTVININYEMPFYKIERQNSINNLYRLSIGLGISF